MSITGATPLPSWYDDAACLDVDPDVFFPAKGSDGAAAKRICWRCPVRQQCLAMALPDPSLIGIFGGTTERERQKMRNGHVVTSHLPRTCHECGRRYVGARNSRYCSKTCGWRSDHRRRREAAA